MAYPSFSAGQALPASDMNAIGLWKITTVAIANTVTSINNCFSSDFDSYRVIVRSLQTNNNTDIFFRLRVGGVDQATGGNYYYAYNGLSSNNNNFNAYGAGADQAYSGMVQVGASNVPIMACSFDIHAPFLAQRTFGLGQAIAYDAQFAHRSGMWEHNLTTSYDGISILTLSAATMTGSISIYGYRK